MHGGFDRVKRSVPLSDSPEKAQADFGEAMAVIASELRKIHFLAFRTGAHSDGCFVAAYPAATNEAFCDGHNAAVTFNRRRPPIHPGRHVQAGDLPASWAMGSGSERATSRSFSPTICSMTASAGRARATTRTRSRDWSASSGGTSKSLFLRAESFAALNDALFDQCRRRQAARLLSQKETQFVRDYAERKRQMSLAIAACSLFMPAVSDMWNGRVRCFLCVTAATTIPCPWPTATVSCSSRGYVDEAVISCGAEVIANHRRSYDSEDLIFDPLHYMPLIEQTISALRPGRPIGRRFGTCPRPSSALSAAPRSSYGQGRPARVRPGGPSTGDHPARRICRGCGQATPLRLSAIGFDAIKQRLVLLRIERRPPRFVLDVFPLSAVRLVFAMTSLQVVHEPTVVVRRMIDHTASAARPPPQVAEAADRPARVRQDRLGSAHRQALITSATC